MFLSCAMFSNLDTTSNVTDSEKKEYFPRETLFVKKTNGQFIAYQPPLHETYQEVNIGTTPGNKILPLPRRNKDETR